MKKILLVLTIVALAACDGNGAKTSTSDKAATEGADTQQQAAVRSGKKNNPLPQGFSLPFAHHIRANRSEPFGGAEKRRVIVEVRGIDLRAADQKLAQVVATRGYTRGQVEERDGGFVVGYDHPTLGQVKTSFFEGKNTKYNSKDATGIMHITWIARR